MSQCHGHKNNMTSWRWSEWKCWTCKRRATTMAHHHLFYWVFKRWFWFPFPLCNNFLNGKNEFVPASIWWVIYTKHAVKGCEDMRSNRSQTDQRRQLWNFSAFLQISLIWKENAKQFQFNNPLTLIRCQEQKLTLSGLLQKEITNRVSKDAAMCCNTKQLWALIAVPLSKCILKWFMRHITPVWQRKAGNTS